MFPPRHEVGVLWPLLVPGPAEHLGLVRVAPAYGGVAPVAGAGQRAVGVQHAPLAARLGVAGPQQPALHNIRIRRLIGEVVQSRRRPLLGPSPG